MTLTERFFGEQIPLEIKSFNLSLLFFFLAVVAFLFETVGKAFPTVFYVATAFIIISVLVSHSFAIRTGRYNVCAFAVSLLVNMVMLPLSYFVDGRLISSVVIYFTVGLFFCVFNLKGVLRSISITGFCLSFFLSVYGMYLSRYRFKNFGLSDISIFWDVILPLGITATYAGIETLYQTQIYEREMKAAEEERLRSEAINQSKDVFLMNMSHEMRTPMNAIINATGLILDKDVKPSVSQHVGHIRSSCDALVSTIDDLLVFSEVDHRERAAAGEEYDLAELLEDIVNLISVRLMDSELSFYVHIDPNLPKTLYGDAMKLRQVFINILNNAVKYTVAGYIEMNVTALHIYREEVILRAVISDTGIGIKESAIPKLFDAFERVDDKLHESMKIEGTGLGLSICKGIVESMGGRISVSSEYNKGTVFTFEVRQKLVDEQPLVSVRNEDVYSVLIYEDDEKKADMVSKALSACRVEHFAARSDIGFENLCRNGRFTHILVSYSKFLDYRKYLDKLSCQVAVICDIDRTDGLGQETDRLVRPVSCMNLGRYLNRATSEKPKAEEQNFSCPDAKVLVVDDNKTNLFVAQGLLTRYGMTVVTASSGRDALNLLDEAGYDMIFIDYMMPEMDGIDTLRAIRASGYEWSGKVPCIVLTADAAEGARQMLLGAGFDDYISKPIQVGLLSESIRRFMDPALIRKAAG